MEFQLDSLCFMSCSNTRMVSSITKYLIWGRDEMTGELGGKVIRKCHAKKRQNFLSCEAVKNECTRMYVCAF